MNGIRGALLGAVLGGCAAFAQWNPAAPLAGLEELKPFHSERASSTDPDWRHGNNDSRPIKAGGSLVLADLAGPGRIVHIWCTAVGVERFYSRLLTVRMYWDGETNPSVECPLGDFFGMGHGVDVSFDSIPVRVTSFGRARNCYWPMPFRKSARIVISNDGTQDCGGFYYQLDWQKVDALPGDTGYFHAMYRQEFPCAMGRNYLIADLRGRGQYVGTALSVYMTSPGWPGEGDDFFFIDGDTAPTLRGTGTEDYFGDGDGLRAQAGEFSGAPFWEGSKTGDRGSAYRWHIPDPVAFAKSLRVEIQHKGEQTFPDGTRSGFIERDDLMSSVAFWYQMEPHKAWPALPAGAARLPFREVILLTGGPAAATARHSHAIQTQILGGTSYRRLWFRPGEERAWLESSFDSKTNDYIQLFARLATGADGGIYRVKVDGTNAGQFDLYAAEPGLAIENLGMRRVGVGTHTLRFECVGKTASSEGYALGFDALMARIPAYSRSPAIDLRHLQKPE